MHNIILQVMFDETDSKTRGFGFVSYEDAEAAERVCCISEFTAKLISYHHDAKLLTVLK